MSRRDCLDYCALYEQKAKSAAISPASSQQLRLYSFVLQNRSGGELNIGALVRLDLANAGFGQLVAASSPNFSDALAAIIAGTTVTIFSTTVNDGFIVQAHKPFNLAGMTVSQASTGSPVYAYEYWNGVSWAALPDVFETPDYSSTGDKYLMFNTPRDWSQGTDAATGGDSAKYTIRAKATTAPGTAVKITALWLGSLIHYMEDVPDKMALSMEYPFEHPRLLDANESFMPYFSAASPKNLITAVYESVK
jgi:hypothetical protein